jgi:hypothetical protein
MLYFKNNELAETYHVSLRTVLNWIEASRQGKLGLALHETASKAYVSNTARNIAIIENIVEQRRKYRNSRGQKSVTPKPAFYSLYNPQQILDIVSGLDIHHEIPLQYSYFDKGADCWDGYVQRLNAEDTPNALHYTQQLLMNNQDYLDNLLSSYSHINVVDIGVGNAIPIKRFLEHLLEKGTLDHYRAIDISTEMLHIAERNIKKWFGGKVAFEGYQYDITYEKFPNLLAGEHIKNRSAKTTNLLMLFGGTLSNLRTPDTALRVLHDSMGRNDFLIHAQKLDSDANRRSFDFGLGKTEVLPAQNKFIVDLLNIDESYYTVETGYDARTNMRFLAIKLKISLSIDFNFTEGAQTIELNKDDSVLVWRAQHQSALDIMHQLDRNEFYPLLASQTLDKQYILTVSCIKHQ